MQQPTSETAPTLKMGGIFQSNPPMLSYSSTTIGLRVGPANFTVEPGPMWSSLESLRSDAMGSLDHFIGPRQVGEIDLHGNRYVIMRRQLFNDLYGLAQDVDRLTNGLLFIRQQLQIAAQLPGSAPVLRQVSDLIYKFPVLNTVSTRAFPPLPLEESERTAEADSGDEEDDYEVDPARIRRPVFHRNH